MQKGKKKHCYFTKKTIEGITRTFSSCYSSIIVIADNSIRRSFKQYSLCPKYQRSRVHFILIKIVRSSDFLNISFWNSSETRKIPQYRTTPNIKHNRKIEKPWSKQRAGLVCNLLEITHLWKMHAFFITYNFFGIGSKSTYRLTF